MEHRDGRTLALHAAAGTVATLTAAWCVLVLTLEDVTTGQLAPVWIAPLMLATIAAFDCVEGLPAAWQFAGQTRDSAQRVLEIARTAPALSQPACALHMDATAPALVFDEVSFGYGVSRVLDAVSFHIQPGEHVAVVGATGAGKSTLLALLMRGWDPSSGTVRMNRADVRDFDLRDLRAHTAVLPQHVHVFNETLRDNVRLARPQATDDELLAVLARAGLADFVAHAPRGLDTRLGEQGTRMSAGERQRLGLARLLLTDATLVLADEPTANLDARSERALLVTLCEWARGRTLVLVSHRRAALAHAERVFTLAAGRITAARTADSP
jgi:ATP-binding cassette subfamily C protein CydC